MDSATILDPKKLAWEQGDGVRIAQIMPGPPNTTLDRSAIGDNEAQYVLNVTMANGVWELDSRYRQFAPSPSTITDEVDVSHALPCFLLQSHLGGGSVRQCNTGTVTIACSDGWGYMDSSGLPNCMSGIVIGPRP